ncbi:MAG: hypothetical protein GTO40_11105, partial [Deltaproteobacteria bacterium]|nr:hypothetical protein [Deltaproteobacteria bacterium]
VKEKSTGSGDLFTCAPCKVPVRILIVDGPAPVNGGGFLSNDGFIRSLSGEKAQLDFATRVMRDLVARDVPLDILKTKISELGGQRVFLFQGAARSGTTISRKTVMIAVHRNRLVTVSLHYSEGGLDDSTRRLVKTFFSSFQFLPER